MVTSGSEDWAAKGRGTIPNQHEAAFRRVQASAEKALLTWVGHPAVATTLLRWRPIATDRIAPFDPVVVDQVDVCVMLAECLGIEGLGFVGQGMTDDPRREERVRRAVKSHPEVALMIVTTLRKVALALSEAGVQLDPGGRDVLFAVGQLLLLEVDLSVPAQQIADLVHALAAGGFSEDGRKLETSRHASQHDQAALSTIQASYRRSLGEGYIQGPYAGGVGRRRPASAGVLVEALHQVLTKFPGCTASQIETTWHSSNARTPGCSLRESMGKHQDENCPKRATLNKALKRLRAPKLPG